MAAPRGIVPLRSQPRGYKQPTPRCQRLLPLRTAAHKDIPTFIPEFSSQRARSTRRKPTWNPGTELSVTSEHRSSYDLGFGSYGLSISFALFATLAVSDSDRTALLPVEFRVKKCALERLCTGSRPASSEADWKSERDASRPVRTRKRRGRLDSRRGRGRSTVYEVPTSSHES
jgi:hypothetical protein